jgi:hypothetical protein
MMMVTATATAVLVAQQAWPEIKCILQQANGRIRILNQSQAAISARVTAAAMRLAGRMSAHLLRWNAI